MVRADGRSGLRDAAGRRGRRLPDLPAVRAALSRRASTRRAPAPTRTVPTAAEPRSSAPLVDTVRPALLGSPAATPGLRDPARRLGALADGLPGTASIRRCRRCSARSDGVAGDRRADLVGGRARGRGRAGVRDRGARSRWPMPWSRRARQPGWAAGSSRPAAVRGRAARPGHAPACSSRWSRASFCRASRPT